MMRQQASLQSLASFWNPLFPGQISDHLVIAEELTENVIDLETLCCRIFLARNRQLVTRMGQRIKCG